MEFATDINSVMYAYIDRKKKFPVTTLLRAIGFDSDRDILICLDFQKKYLLIKKSLKNAIGETCRKSIRKWSEDFVDEDTGEVVTLEKMKSSWKEM